MEKGKQTYKLPEGWVLVDLGNIAFINMGQSPPSSSYNYNQIGLPFYQGKSEFGDIYPIVEKYCSEPIKVVDSDDVLISVRAPIGPTNLVKDKSCIGRGLAGIKAFGGMSGKFLLYQFRTLEKVLQEKGTGTTFKAISKSILEHTSFKIPPLMEQQRIVSKIESLYSELDDAEKEFLKAKHQLEVYKQALLKNAFKGKLTEQWRQGKSTNISQSKDYSLPIEWKYTKIESISSFIGSGSTPKGGRNVYKEKGIPFIRSQNIYPNSFLQDDLVFISESINLKMKRTQTHPKDVLLNITGASIGRCAYIPENFREGNVNQHVCIIRTIPDYINYKYLTYILNSPEIQSLIKRINSGATREALNLSQIRNIEIPICNIQEQEQIVFHLDSKYTLIKNIEDSINKELLNIEKLKLSILNDAFNGKLVPQNENEESAFNLLNQIKKEKTLYLKKIKSEKMKTSSENKNSKKKKTLLELLSEEYSDNEFSFEDIRKLSNLSYEDLKTELYLLLDKNKELEIVFDKSVKKILYRIKS